MQHILENVLRKIKPSKKEETRVRDFVAKITKTSKSISGLDTAVVGSIGKNTWLSGNHDVDVFITFPKDVPREEMAQKGLDYGKKIVEEMNGRWQIKYAEHPYTNAKIKGFEVDIVPCYHIQKGEHIQSAVDRSPLHMQYVLDHTSPRMQDEIRLLKQFCKGIGVYGSDAKHLGFSGYICELLILYYQNFEAAVRAASSWQAPQVIDLMGFADKNKFPDQPLIIIDPVDKDRNAAAVISSENFIKFMAACKQFVEKPAPSFFSPSAIQPLNDKQTKYLLNRGTRFLAVKMKTPEVVEDVLYPQLRKALKRVENFLHHNEFSVLRAYEFVGSSCYMIFEMEVFSLPHVNNQDGPPVFARQHSADFLAKYKGKNFVYLDGNNWVAEVKREHKTPVALLGAFIKRDKDKLVADGLPTYIAATAASMKILDHQQLFAAAKKDRELSDFLREKYFVDIGKIL